MDPKGDVKLMGRKEDETEVKKVELEGQGPAGHGEA
jgi:hypothetical protein